MIQKNHQTYIIEKSDIELAQNHNFNGKENTLRGMLGEIALSKYLDIPYVNPGYNSADIVDKFGTKYQVKTTVEGPQSVSHWVEQAKRPDDFDYYVFCVINNTNTEIIIEAIMPVGMVNVLIDTHPSRPDLYRIKRKRWQKNY